VLLSAIRVLTPATIFPPATGSALLATQKRLLVASYSGMKIGINKLIIYTLQDSAGYKQIAR